MKKIMKPKNVILLSSLIVISVVMVTTMPTLAAGESVIFEDDFESGNLSNWNIISGNWEIIIEEGNHIAHLNRSSEYCRILVSKVNIPDSAIIKAKVKGDADGDAADTTVGFYSNSNGSSFYYLMLGAWDGMYLTIGKRVDNVEYELVPNKSIAPSNNIWYNVKIKLEDSNISAKIWSEGNNEPPDWQISYLGAEKFGEHIVIGTEGGQHNEEFWFDNISVNASDLPFTYTGDVLPSADGWSIIWYEDYESTSAQIEGGVLHINDPYTYSGSGLSYYRAWPSSPDCINVAEFDVKVVSCSGIVGVYIGTNDENYNMIYNLFTDRIQSRYAITNNDSTKDCYLGDVYYFDTTSQFNTYKAVIDDGIAKLYLNGELVLEQPAGTGVHREDWPTLLNYSSGVEFGVAGSPTTGEAYFDEIRAYSLEENVSNPTVSFYPPNVSLSLNSTATLDLTLNNAPKGLSGYNISISLSSPSVAEVTALTSPSWVSIHTNSTLPSDSLWVKAIDLGDQVKVGVTNITLATLTLRGDTRGNSSDILINVTKMDDDNGYPIEANTIPGQIEVFGVISFPGCDGMPTDSDSDGFYEDTNGNGRLDFNDVVVFFNYLEWIEGNQPCTECFDFNENTYIDFDDIVDLFNEV